MHDYYPGIALKSLQVTATIAIDGAEAGTNIAERFVARADGVSVEALAAGATRFGWDPDPLAERYDVQQETLPNFASAVCRTDQDFDPTDTEYVESATPPPGEGWIYLVRGVDDACGGPGPWGDGRADGVCP